MNKFYSLLSILIFAFSFSFTSKGQTYNMPTSPTTAQVVGTTINTCSGTFYDNGGTANYTNDQNAVQTFCSTSGLIRFTFTVFSMKSTADYLKIYDGASTASPLIGTYSATSPGTITSTGTCLTFEFISNSSGVTKGWAATISCISANDNCSNPISLNSSGACSYVTGSTVGATNSTTAPNPACANYTAGASIDVWYSFVASNTNQTINTTTGTITDGGMALYSGTCGALSLIECDDDDSPNGLMPMITRTDFVVGNTYYVRFWAYSTSTTGDFGICVSAPVTLTCPTGLGTGYSTVTLPYTQNSQTTCGDVNDLNSANITACGSSSYYTGEDYVYIFTPTASGQSTITLTSTGSWTGLMLYAGCPFSGGTCVAQSQSSTGNKSMCVNLINGTTYYLIIDSYASPTCNPYDISITAPSGIPAGTTCANAVSIGGLPYSATSQSTACMGNDYSNSSTGSCNSLYESGEDKVYTYTATGSECISISLTSTSTSSIGFQVYSGCPGTAGTTCVGNAGGASSGTLTGSVVLPAAGTYYIIVDTWSSPENATYNISVSTFGSGQANDLPCNATSLTLGASESGNNNCTGNSGEPATPTCWTSGYRNTVWYKVVPTGTSLRIKTYLGTLTNTQIAVYSGTCGAGMTMVASACNDNAAVCGSNTNYNSELYVTGLTAGNTYYIAVDGANDLVGSFSIVAIDGASSFPAVQGMDCSIPNPVCAQNFTVSDPGYSGFGNTCDLPSSYCLASSERNVVWYTIPINNGTPDLVFDIVPNDFNATSESETDYDFAIWKLGGAVTCSSIAAGTSVPLECNYSGLGVTGLNSGSDGTAPSSLSATACPQCPGGYNPTSYNGAYQAAINVANGDVYLLAISNYSNSTSGFHIDFLNSPIGYVGTTTTSVTWTGGTNSTASLAANWGGCNVPSCSVDGTIAPFTNQPVISTNMTFKDLTIQPGASLTINAGITVTICGNLTNSGSLICDPTSTILFTNPITHTMSGSFTGTNALGNLTLTASGAGLLVNLMNDLDLKGSFTTSNANSIFNSNGNYIKVAGSFLNSNGTTTFTNTSGTLEFNGTAAQTYDPTVTGGTNLTLTNVVANNTKAGYTDITILDNMLIGTTGTLTLTNGTIVTNALEVTQNNTSTTSVTTGNINSFVQGNLRRSILSTGSYDFPVGHATPGYQRANINFTAATSIGNLLARFDPWGTNPIQGGTECGMTYNQLAENNGYWTITANANATTGTYNTTLYPLNATNTTGMAGWTVIKAATAAGPWVLNGTCVTSTATQVMRNGMNGFSAFAAAQSLTPLPIELLSFTGKSLGKRNLLEWATATEINNDYFTLERSSDGSYFETVAIIDGAGNSVSTINYSKYDETPFYGMTYYRLKQTDYNGEYSYSQIIALENGLNDVELSNVHPNPTTNDINFDLYSPISGTVKVQILDYTGRIVIEENIVVSNGKTRLNAKMGELAKGIYSLKVGFDQTGYSSVNMIIKQ